MKVVVLALLMAAPIALRPLEVLLPEDEAVFIGPDSDLLNGNCTACHSAEMVLAQPRLSEEQWRHSVEKMRTVYKAPIEDADAAKLPAALVRVQRP